MRTPADILAAMRAMTGDLYTYGGSHPAEPPGAEGDCSGKVGSALVCAGYRAPGFSMRAVDLANDCGAVGRDAVRPGDLVFFGSPVYHVGVVTDRGGPSDLWFLGANHGGSGTKHGQGGAQLACVDEQRVGYMGSGVPVCFGRPEPRSDRSTVQWAEVLHACATGGWPSDMSAADRAKIEAFARPWVL